MSLSLDRLKLSVKLRFSVRGARISLLSNGLCCVAIPRLKLGISRLMARSSTSLSFVPKPSPSSVFLRYSRLFSFMVIGFKIGKIVVIGSKQPHLSTRWGIVPILKGKILTDRGYQFFNCFVIGSFQRFRLEKMRSVSRFADDIRFCAVLDVADQGVFLIFPLFRPIEFIFHLHGEAKHANF